MMWNRMFGPMGWSYWVLITCNIALPQLMWIRKFRVNVGLMFIMSLIINTGMWFERFVIVVTSLTRDYLPSSWGTYRATQWDYATFAGNAGIVHVSVLPVHPLLPMIPDVGDAHDAAAGEGAARRRNRNWRQVTDACTAKELYGLLAEFETPTQLVQAARAAYAAGYRRMDCYTPYPVEEAAEAIGFHATRCRW